MGPLQAPAGRKQVLIVTHYNSEIILIRKYVNHHFESLASELAHRLTVFVMRTYNTSGKRRRLFNVEFII